ncbi:hypothetical protein V1478_004255 [Vespula squamosa]|uniref:Uncharacterized protein n=1 Tax=Vespula squamosa TaxID=30214 RepID=A0ABD2BHV2_VESSQ
MKKPLTHLGSLGRRCKDTFMKSERTTNAWSTVPLDTFLSYNFYYYVEKFRTFNFVSLTFFPASPTHMSSSFFEETCTAKKLYVFRLVNLIEDTIVMRTSSITSTSFTSSSSSSLKSFMQNDMK